MAVQASSAGLGSAAIAGVTIASAVALAAIAVAVLLCLSRVRRKHLRDLFTKRRPVILVPYASAAAYELQENPLKTNSQQAQRDAELTSSSIQGVRGLESPIPSLSSFAGASSRRSSSRPLSTRFLAAVGRSGRELVAPMPQPELLAQAMPSPMGARVAARVVRRLPGGKTLVVGQGTVVNERAVTETVVLRPVSSGPARWATTDALRTARPSFTAVVGHEAFVVGGTLAPAGSASGRVGQFSKLPGLTPLTLSRTGRLGDRH